jgi:hypothetical protein
MTENKEKGNTLPLWEWVVGQRAKGRKWREEQASSDQMEWAARLPGKKTGGLGV